MSEADLKQLITETRTSLENRIDGVEKRFDGLENRFDRLENRFDALGTEMRLHFDVVVESLDAKVRLVMENFEQLTRAIHSVKLGADQGIGETREMLKFSHGELDRRVTTLESAIDRSKQ